MEKAVSPFEFVVPDWWPKNYFLYTLYYDGFISVIDTDRYNIICQNCTLTGKNIFYQPSHVLIANPLIRSPRPLQIGTECELIMLTPDYYGVFDTVSLYADLMACIMSAAGNNVLLSKLAYIIFAKNKSMAETLKSVVDQVIGGQPAVAANTALWGVDSDKLYDVFTRDLKTNFIAPDLLEMLRRVESMFCEEIGLPNANTEKKERLITDEVQANNFSTVSKCLVWYDCLKTSMGKTRKLFGIPDSKLNVKWRKGVLPDGNVSSSDGSV